MGAEVFPATNPGEALLRCERLVVGYGGQALLPPCDLTFSRGTLTVMVGRNGAGKSTLFRTILGLLPPVGGRVMRLVPELRCAYVGQAMALDRALPVRARDVVAWGRIGGSSFWRLGRAKGDRAACERALADAGVSDLGNKPFHDLSEGQKERVLLARALAAEPDLAFLDEPTAAMDTVAEEDAIAHLAGLCGTRGLAVVVISHVLPLAARFADEVVFLDRDNRVVISGPPATVFAHPAFQRQFGVPEDRGG